MSGRIARTGLRGTFRLPDLRAGFAALMPLAAVVAVHGATFGVLARIKGLQTGEFAAMGFLVFAGAAQFLALDSWASTLPVFEIVLATLIVNLRYVMICASLRGTFAGTSLPAKALGIHLVADENWARTMALPESRRTPGFVLGGGVALLLAWVGAGLVGHSLGAAIVDTTRYGLDFALTAAFVALAIGFWRGRSDALPWMVAGATAWGASLLVPGRWYILVGALAGAAVIAATAGKDARA